MTDPLTFNTAIAMANGALGLLKQAKESAKMSDDHDLKDKLSEVFDTVLELKEAIGTLRDENAELRAQLNTRASLKWSSQRKLYFAEGDFDPFCPACFDTSGRQIRLQPQPMYGQTTFHCRVCKNSFEG